MYPIESQPTFWRTCCLHLQHLRISQAQNQYRFLAWLIIQPEDGGIPLKCWLIFNGLYGIKSQKTEFFLLAQ
jgi:hypothetical protein